MVQRKKRLPVVLDTNVFVRALKAGSHTNWNRRIVRLWLIERQLQLVVSRELIAEYLGIFNLLLATATSGEARFLITNDRDLLEVSDAVKQTLKYAIITPQEFLKHWDAE